MSLDFIATRDRNICGGDEKQVVGLMINCDGQFFIERGPVDGLGVTFALNVPALFYRLAGKVYGRNAAFQVTSAVGTWGPPTKILHARQKQNVVCKILK